ncbi:cupin domain protein [Amylocarpus encephaloides]|uniref:Cupin domain protein n=1 Tax=Amylocarpus encephaloides TaxID=45428 RepID=A0A9P7YRR4_9HELO|nr:cupin domain protein [Amylocarpus encephaloides]
MSIHRVTQPPTDGSSYVIPQLEGEMISIPGSKSVCRVLTSAIQTNGAMSVFSSGSVLADAPGFHHHNEAHDVFLVVKGYLKLWNGDKCKILGPGDFASVPPGFIHNPHWTGPISETFGLITPGEWLDFFRYIGEPRNCILLPEDDDRPLAEILIPKIIAAKGKYDVVFHPTHQGCEVSGWNDDDERLPNGPEPYYLRANTGPRWMLGGVMSRPFCTTIQSKGKFAISSIESSSVYKLSKFPVSFNFPTVHHCFCVFEGVLEVTIAGGEPTLIREGETVFLAANTVFSLKFRSKFVRLWSFTNGDGIEALIQRAGRPFAGFVLPDKEPELDEARLKAASESLKIHI